MTNSNIKFKRICPIYKEKGKRVQQSARMLPATVDKIRASHRRDARLCLLYWVPHMWDTRRKWFNKLTHRGHGMFVLALPSRIKLIMPFIYKTNKNDKPICLNLSFHSAQMWLICFKLLVLTNYQRTNNNMLDSNWDCFKVY